ncbi:O-methylsterigmatocystin oxidoreductase [Trametes pubescens]|uniref:O-methylsterigmatocystin oxidoreductase n=1 Tax=Trametes pubescens TaxID=154538 RepID=A0A1M2W179_TRAPU|nr:O-methylsterigmatocystin oxidoreductase [Trametes pubescens]
MDLTSLFGPDYAVLLLAIACVASLRYLRSLLDWKARSQGLPLPPGPKPLPIVGNLFGLPKIKPWSGFQDMRKEHGDLVYLRVFGKGLLVIGSVEVAYEFLDKRSANTSDRPESPVIGLSGQESNFGLFPYSPWWRQHRREFWQFFHPGVISKYQPTQRTEVRKFLGRLLNSPSRFKSHIEHMSASAILKLVYGIDIVDEDDERIVIPHAALETTRRSTPASFAVDLFPILRHVPSWFPGAGFQKVFAECKVANDYLKHAPFDEAKEALERGDSRPCIVADMLARAKMNSTDSTDLSDEMEDMVKNVCATTVEASADTSLSTLQAIFVAMALYPAVQRKAQAALDAVVGPSRLPDFTNSAALPYIHAIVKEALRWCVVSPLGLAHRTLRDDVFHGCFVPAGTTVHANAWAMLHDPATYEHPDEFRPERFLRDGLRAPGPTTTALGADSIAFGFGRRLCPGRHFALESLFITVASVLHVFDIGLPLDADGAPIQVKFEQSHGAISYPEDCRCTVTPRSKAAEALILAAHE